MLKATSFLGCTAAGRFRRMTRARQKGAIGKCLRELRDRKGLTQEQLAEAVGCRKSTIGKWEHGDSSPDARELALICETLGVTADSVIFDPSPTNDTASYVSALAGVWIADLDMIEQAESIVAANSRPRMTDLVMSQRLVLPLAVFRFPKRAVVLDGSEVAQKISHVVGCVAKVDRSLIDHTPRSAPARGKRD